MPNIFFNSRFKIPVLGERISAAIAITTTVEINRGIYEIVCTNFFRKTERISFKRSAKIIGIGKFISKFISDKVNVFLNARQKAGSLKNIEK